jgi:hypothetical protein
VLDENAKTRRIPRCSRAVKSWGLILETVLETALV